MANTATLTPSAIYSNYDDNGSWASDDYRVGYASGIHWRSKIVLPISDDLAIGKSTKLAVAITIGEYTSYPGATSAVLSADGDLTPAQVLSADKVGIYRNGPHADLLATSLAESRAYYDAEGTSQIPYGTSQSKNNVFYFVFDTTELKAGQTYYIYAVRNTPADYTGLTGFVRAPLDKMSATLTYESTYTVSVSHFGVAEDGTQVSLDWQSYTVEAGSSFTPPLITPPEDYTTEGATFKLWTADWSALVGSGTPGVDYVTVDSDLVGDVYYPIVPGSYVYVNQNGEAVKCEVYVNVNGVAVRCEVYANVNGTAVKT